MNIADELKDQVESLFLHLLSGRLDEAQAKVVSVFLAHMHQEAGKLLESLETP